MCLAAGVGAFLVGMIGFGSSLVILPTLLLVFPLLFDADVAVRLAVGTTMASMVVGAVSAGIAQTRRGAVNWPLLRVMVAPYLLGAGAGPWLSRYLSVDVLSVYIVVILVVVAVLTLRRTTDARQAAREWRTCRLQIFFVHVLIGLVSSVAGIASGLFAIPYLTRFALPLREAIGTSTIAAALYSAFATIGHMTAGAGVDGRPEWTIGFVYLPAFVAMSVTGGLCGMLGVGLAQRISEQWLRRVLAVFLVAAALVIAFR
mgnify:FL=1